MRFRRHSYSAIVSLRRVWFALWHCELFFTFVQQYICSQCRQQHASKAISEAKLSHWDEMWHILLSGKWRRHCHVLVMRFPNDSYSTYINTCSQQWQVFQAFVHFLQNNGHTLLYWASKHNYFKYKGCMLVLCFNIQLYFQLEVSCVVYCFFSFSLLTQQRLCPPEASAGSPACPHNDSNHTISHRSTQRHHKLGLGSVHLPFNQFRMRTYLQNFNFENPMFGKVLLHLPTEITWNRTIYCKEMQCCWY